MIFCEDCGTILNAGPGPKSRIPLPTQTNISSLSHDRQALIRTGPAYTCI